MLFGKKSGIKNRNRERYERVRRLMWIKCESCGKLVYYKDYKDNKYICPSCGRAFIMTPKQRFDLLFDDNTWEKLTPPNVSDDPLKFVDRIAYTERLDDARSETGCYDAVSTADGTIGGVPSTVCVLNGLFMMGSMGRAAGDAIVAAMEHAVAERRPFIMVTSSGGARMQENILSLMQMARTTAAVNKLHANGIPYIVLLTDPTFGGVTASFAMLGDIHIAEKGARIGFAGRRVIEQNIREKLPSNFQTAEYLYEHGMVDMVVARGGLHDAIAKILAVLTKQKRPPKQIVATTPAHDASKKIRGMGENEAYDKVLLARHENRPHFLDYINGIVDDWTYLAGDRLYAEDAAMGSGIGFWRGIPAVIIGQEQGRTIETRQKHRFGMANPDGYRKAVRMMRLAEKFQLPLISLFDTAGAFAGREGEERGQSQAVAQTVVHVFVCFGGCVSPVIIIGCNAAVVFSGFDVVENGVAVGFAPGVVHAVGYVFGCPCLCADGYDRVRASGNGVAHRVVLSGDRQHKAQSGGQECDLFTHNDFVFNVVKLFFTFLGCKSTHFFWLFAFVFS